MISRSEVRKGIENPGKAIRFTIKKSRELKRRAGGQLYRRYRGIERQSRFINEIINETEFVLVVLDACRYDCFEDVCSSYLTGDLEKVWSSGRWTADYVRRTWTDKHDLTYLTAIPVISDFYFERTNMNYRPSEHFDSLVPLWDTDWDSSLGTVPGKNVTDTALAYCAQVDPTRLVVHYSQPHAPYIGETEILPWDDEPESMRQLLEKDTERPNQRIYDRIRNGDISRSKLKQAYIDNLESVLEEVVRLVKRVDCPVVITGDHGEHLGEGNKYLHEQESTLIRQVPWFTVDSELTGQIGIESVYENTSLNLPDEQSAEEIEKRLVDLGYKK